jgi:hypothetical protein
VFNDNVDVMMVFASPGGPALTRGHDYCVHEAVGSILPLNLSDTVPRCLTLTDSVASGCFRQAVRLLNRYRQIIFVRGAVASKTGDTRIIGNSSLR